MQKALLMPFPAEFTTAPLARPTQDSIVPMLHVARLATLRP
jgi:membrane protein YqaA with SNARE-associated domain